MMGILASGLFGEFGKKNTQDFRERTYVVSFMYIDAYVYTFMYEYAHGVCVGGFVRERARD